jgi:hypothetical protein
VAEGRRPEVSDPTTELNTKIITSLLLGTGVLCAALLAVVSVLFGMEGPMVVAALLAAPAVAWGMAILMIWR